MVHHLLKLCPLSCLIVLFWTVEVQTILQEYYSCINSDSELAYKYSDSLLIIL